MTRLCWRDIGSSSIIHTDLSPSRCMMTPSYARTIAPYRTCNTRHPCLAAHLSVRDSGSHPPPHPPVPTPCDSRPDYDCDPEPRYTPDFTRPTPGRHFPPAAVSSDRICDRLSPFHRSEPRGGEYGQCRKQNKILINPRNLTSYTSLKRHDSGRFCTAARYR